MKNITYFPFERNHYYYGKLLTVDDFELEQRYSNNKRRMVNRFLHGSGVINGMYIVGVDDRSISLEAGAAIDFAGREIVVEKPVTKALSDIEGFEDCQEENQPYVYLCIEYDEQQKEIVYNAAGGNDSGGGEEFNKCRESYRLYLTGEEPDFLHTLSGLELYRKKNIVYWENGIRIWQSLPRFVRAGEPFELEIEIENMGQQQPFALSYELELMFLKYENRSRLKVDFDERLEKKSSRYTLKYKMSAAEADNVSGSAKISSESFRISVGGKSVKGEIKGKTEAFIVNSTVTSALADHYYKTEMENMINNSNKPCIYLAKLILTKAGNSCVIHEIENMPFHQYVWNSNLSYATDKFLLKELTELKGQVEKNRLQNMTGLSAQDGQNEYRFGTEELFIGKSKRKGSKFFTEEIVHGLGLGEVCVVLGVENEEGQVICGQPSVFENKDGQVVTAAQTDPEKGTFIIGVRLVEANCKESLKIHWMAYKDPNGRKEENGEKRILIRPNIVTVNVRETRYLEAVCQNMNDRRLKWTVEQYGGIIDKNGMYTAPDKKGVYEVTASSMVYPNVEASVFIIVKDNNASQKTEQKE